MKWAPTFSSIYVEQVALLHRPEQLDSDETEEFLPKHVPHVWAKILQFHRRLVGWAGATEPLAHNKPMRT